jgi:adrenodoxin-NADP+ reductase
MCRVGSVRIEKTKLNGNPNAQRALGTGCFETVPCDLALRSIGYKSHPIVGLPFDSNKHVISNVGGRVVDPDTKEHIIGLYCAGWVKRGPSGIIGSNIIDARETVAKIMEDVRAGNILSKTTSDNDGAIFTKINKRVTSWKDFQVIDREEVARGIARSKTREKVASVEDMIKILDK